MKLRSGKIVNLNPTIMSTAGTSNSKDWHLFCSTPFLTREKVSKHPEDISSADLAAATPTPTIKSFDCPNCSLSFSAKMLLREHQKTTHPETIKSFDCSSCNLNFSTRKKLSQHTKKQHPDAINAVGSTPKVGLVSIKPFKCPNCNCSFATQKKASKHKRKMHPEGVDPVESDTTTIESFDCSSCNLSFSTKLLLRKHKKKMHPKNIKSIICSSCSLSFSTPKKLSKHERKRHPVAINPAEPATTTSATTTESFDCPSCNLPFLTKKLLRSHDQEAHPKCKQCKEKFPCLEKLQSHQQITAHCFCRECDIHFPSVREQLVHVRNITHTSPHHCCDCNREYTNQEALSYHCCDCDKVNQSQKSLEKHLRTKRHLRKVEILKSENPQDLLHKCKKCETEFHDKKQLKKHMASIHKPPRNIQCPAGGKCEKKFATPSALLNHLESGCCKSGMTRAKLHRVVLAHDPKCHITSAESTELIRSSEFALASQPSRLPILIEPSSHSLSRNKSPEPCPFSNDDNLSEWSTINSGPLTPTTSDSNWSVIGGNDLTPTHSDDASDWSVIDDNALTPTHSDNASDWSAIGDNALTPTHSDNASERSFVSEDLVGVSSIAVSSNATFDLILHRDTTSQNWRCDLCPPSRKAFRSLKGYQAHINSASHAPKIFHCPLSLIPNVKPETLSKIRHFSTLGGLAQHLESGRCEGGLELYNKAITVVEEQLSLLGLSGLLPSSN